MKRLMIAVAGAGTIGRRHIELIRASASCELSAIVDPAQDAADLARQAGVAIHASLGDLLARARPDGVIVASPNPLHVEHGLCCVEKGVPMLIEKPIADSLIDAQRLADAAERAGVAVLVGHHRRHSPILLRAREVVQSGTLGDIVGISGSATFRKPDGYFDQAPWRRQAGGGPILINMIHEVDDLRFLFGEIVAVQAFSSSSARGHPVEDSAAINFRFASGALASFLLSDAAAATRSWEQTSRENASYAHDPHEDCYLVAGTRGSLSIPRLWLRTYGGEPSWTSAPDTRVLPVDAADPLSRQLEHFCAVIRGEAVPLVGARDAMRSLRVTLAIAEAARTGATVSTI